MSDALVKELLAALRVAVAEIERLRYSRTVCPGCNQQPHARGCPLVSALETGHAAIKKATGA